uniref:DRBM domain-containing protein n=1 Tax=viral metagenome TaxID=1070528 RepID=A0A6C0EK98_9ZZZZ
MSAKNKLQEIYQKRQLALPVYETVRVNDHWRSTVTLCDNRTFVGEEATKKSVAESNVAQIALKAIPQERDESPQALSQIPLRELSRLCQDSKTIVLIDVENIPQSLESSFPSDVKVIGVVGHCSSVAKKSFPFHKYVVRSALRDAADHSLSFLAGFLASTSGEETKFILVSRDHFAEITAFNLRSQGFQAHHVTGMFDNIF